MHALRRLLLIAFLFVVDLVITVSSLAVIIVMISGGGEFYLGQTFKICRV